MPLYLVMYPGGPSSDPEHPKRSAHHSAKCQMGWDLAILSARNHSSSLWHGRYAILSRSDCSHCWSTVPVSLRAPSCAQTNPRSVSLHYLNYNARLNDLHQMENIKLNGNSKFLNFICSQFLCEFNLGCVTFVRDSFATFKILILSCILLMIHVTLNKAFYLFNSRSANFLMTKF